LVFLYSAPPCPDGARIRVQFRAGNELAQNTPYQDCVGFSVNFLLGGLKFQTQYSVRPTVDTGSQFQEGPVLNLTTPAAAVDFVARTVLQSPPFPLPNAILLAATTASNPMATDLNGNVVWYYPGKPNFDEVGPFLLVRPDRGGYFWGMIENPAGDRSQQLLREYDLTGRTVLETNAARVSEQLVAMGKHPIGAFHHEARRLPDGTILTLATTERILTDVQGDGPVDVIGDTIVVMDRNLQVVWAWDAFDHLDASRPATLRDRCPFGGCPPLFLAAAAQDWLHGNSVVQTPDGHLLYSSRSQDWVIKIDYWNGEGGGDVLWRLGKDGDFQFNSTDPYPWFSHQHDAQLLNDNESILLLDNGNVRATSDPTANSRGQLIRIDEQSRVATLGLNVDLGGFSGALGSAQLLPNGDYHFDLGVVSGSSSSISLEVDPSGKTVYALRVAAPAYRTFRMRDIYTP
jgi:arylsulfate sulfotransferase